MDIDNIFGDSGSSASGEFGEKSEKDNIDKRGFSV